MTLLMNGPAIVAIAAFAASGALAQSAAIDPPDQDQMLELNLGLFAPFNTLQDTLTTPNGGGDQVQTTDALSFGAGNRLDVKYSRPWGENSRLVFSLTRSSAIGDSVISVGSEDETFPGTYDDGFRLPADWTSEVEIQTNTTMLMIGREWALNRAWRVSGGLQAGQASHDLSAGVYDTTEVLDRTFTSTSSNKMYGIFGGASYHTAMNDSLALRISGNLGVMNNEFDYDYINIREFDQLIEQEVSGSDSGAAVSLQLAARIERRLSDQGMLILEIGYEGLQGIGNGADTALDEDGTATTADIDKGMIGAAYISAGYAFKF